jgi:hypothetical protein
MTGMIGLPSASASSSSFSHSTEASDLGVASRTTASHTASALRSVSRQRAPASMPYRSMNTSLSAQPLATSHRRNASASTLSLLEWEINRRGTARPLSYANAGIANGVQLANLRRQGKMQRLLHLHHGGCTMTFATSASVVGFLKAGTLRPLAVTTIKRFSLMPDLPTVAELGLPGFDATTWHGLVAPAGTPRDVIDTLNRATVQTLKDADTLRQLRDIGVEVSASTPEEFAAYIRSEIPKWAAVVKASGAQVE